MAQSDSRMTARMQETRVLVEEGREIVRVPVTIMCSFGMLSGVLSGIRRSYVDTRAFSKAVCMFIFLDNSPSKYI